MSTRGGPKNSSGPDAQTEERLRWLCQRVLAYFPGLPADSWDGMLVESEKAAGGANKSPVEEFASSNLSNGALARARPGMAPPSLFFFEQEPGVLGVTTAVEQVPAEDQGIAYVLLRTVPAAALQTQPSDTKHFASAAIVGELRSKRDALPHLAALSEDLVAPLASSKVHQRLCHWPDVLAKDLNTRLHDFKGRADVQLGAAQGHTLLPLPPVEIRTVDQAADDPEIVRLLEASVVAWNRQLTTVVTLDSRDTGVGPLGELDFWRVKAEDLRFVQQQLQGVDLQRIVRVLMVAASTYYSDFTRKLGEIDDALVEADETNKYLGPLRPYFERLRDTPPQEFAQVVHLYRPILYVLQNVWHMSQFYSTTRRVVIMLKAICFRLVAKAREYVDAATVLRDDRRAVIMRIRTALAALRIFRETFQEFRDRIQRNSPDHYWSFEDRAVFGLLDAFVVRCRDIIDFIKTVRAFQQLDGLEIGGGKGRIHTVMVHQVYVEFLAVWRALQSVDYDVLNPDDKGFEADFFRFRALVRDWEVRLAAVVAQGFAGSTVVGTLQLLQSLRPLLDREPLTVVLERHYPELLGKFLDEINAANVLFARRRDDDGPLGSPFPGMPQYGGCLAWARGMLARIRDPYRPLMALCPASLRDADEVVQIVTRYEQVVGQLQAYERGVHEAWLAEVAVDSSASRLDQCLIRRADLLTAARFNYAGSSHSLRDHFEDLDGDNDGCLTQDELWTLLSRLGLELSDEDIEEAMKVLDSNNDGVIAFDEFTRWWSTNFHSIRIAFAEIDADGSGYIDGNEFSELLKRLGINFTRAQFVQALEALERGSLGQADGRLDFMEFLVWWRNFVTHSGNQLLVLNFDQGLMRLLREVKHMRLLGWPVPADALEVSKWEPAFQGYLDHLELIISMYNGIHVTTLPVERMLIQERLDAIDTQLVKALTVLTWQSRGIKDYLSATLSLVSELSDKLTSLNENLQWIEDTLRAWSAEPLITRRATKVLDLAAEQAKLRAFCDRVRNDGEEIHKIVAAGYHSVGVHSRNHSAWRDYLVFLNQVAAIGFKTLIRTSLTHLLEHMEDEDRVALIEVKLELAVDSKSLVFTPDLDGHENGLFDKVSDIIDTLFSMGSLMSRIDGVGEDYTSTVLTDSTLQMLRGRVLEVVASAMDRCRLYRQQSYVPFEFIYTENRAEFLQAFLVNDYDDVFSDVSSSSSDDDDDDNNNNNNDATASAAAAAAEAGDAKQEGDGGEEEDEEEDEEDENFGEFGDVPRLRAFDRIIAKFNTFLANIVALPPQTTFGCVRIDCKPVQMALCNLVGKWHFTFESHLETFLTSSLTTIGDFTLEMTTLLQQHDRHQLADTMRCLQAIQERSNDVNRIFTPLRKTAQLLRKFEVAIKPETARAIEETPAAWESLLQLSIVVREELRLAVAMEAQSVAKREQEFAGRVRDFHSSRFATEAPFAFGVGLGGAYRALDVLHLELERLEDEAAALLDTEDLYQMQPVDAEWQPLLKTMREQLADLKGLWDVASLVLNQISEWEKLAWNHADLGAVEGEARLFARSVTSLPRRVREWNSYLELRTLTRDHLAALPLIVELRDEAMRDRHWKLLVWHTKIELSGKGDYRLGELLQLQLHRSADAVHSVVEQARREQALEKALVEMDEVWGRLEFLFDLPPNPADIPHNLLSAAAEVAATDVDPMSVSQVIAAVIANAATAGGAERLAILAANRSPAPLVFQPLESIIEVLEEKQVVLQNMVAGKYVSNFADDVKTWQDRLSIVEQAITVWAEVQLKWRHLEPIFMGLGPGTVDIQSHLPHDHMVFKRLDADFRVLMEQTALQPNVLAACEEPGRLARLENMVEHLDACTKSLEVYLETKREIFPRFYFLSAEDLLDIISNGHRPMLVEAHVPKLFDNVQTLEYVDRNDPGRGTFTVVSEAAKEAAEAEAEAAKEAAMRADAVERRARGGNAAASAAYAAQAAAEADGGGEAINILAAFSSESERLTLPGDLAVECDAAVEAWLGDLVSHLQRSVQQQLAEAIQGHAAAAGPNDDARAALRTQLLQFPSQVVCLAAQVRWCAEVQRSFDSVEMGEETALRDYNVSLSEQLSQLVQLIRGQLAALTRASIMNLATILVHTRDVVSGLVKSRVEASSDFAWQSQLRFYWDPKTKNCVAKVCDATFDHSYEYVGNRPRLVITPLTDRCYITLTQALRYRLGGAPAGPAGTGKTETTKDLGRALGRMVYVFNCSEQMGSRVLAGIFKGLASSGSWGCFDEFNRIAVEVLSVVSTQFKAVLDGMRRLNGVEGHFELTGDRVRLHRLGCGVFVTMNPGYAGRTELPQSLKALFRPISMVVPDLALICENMLLAEGFEHASALARKTVHLYRLTAALLSRQDHYDWGLRAIKSVLVVAGQLNREAADAGEGLVLMRALHDFNVPKLVSRDVPVFKSLLQDIFPEARSSAAAAAAAAASEGAGHVATAARALQLQPEPAFVAKVNQLQALLSARHCVFILGPAKAAKTAVWRTLAKANDTQGRPTTALRLNPKALDPDELYGCLSSSTHDWKDGVLSSAMRNMASAHDKYNPHWLVLDGDIDPVWIENLNSVMDDNKMLTLASNERIRMTPSMRLLFESGHLRHATPATVSRAGVLFLNAADVGWRPLVTSWAQARSSWLPPHLVVELAEQFFPACIGMLERIRAKQQQQQAQQQPQGSQKQEAEREEESVVLSDFCLVQTSMRYLQSFVPAESVPPNVTGPYLTPLVAFSALWGFGGSLPAAQQRRFSELFRGHFENVGFPSSLDAEVSLFDLHMTVNADSDAFDNHHDDEPTPSHSRRHRSLKSSKRKAPAGAATEDEAPGDIYPHVKFAPWGEWDCLQAVTGGREENALEFVEEDEEGKPPPDLATLLMPTSHTARLAHMAGRLMNAQIGAPVLLIGAHGVGKTVLAAHILSAFADAHDSHYNAQNVKISLNFNSDSRMMQERLEAPLEKKAAKGGKALGPKDVGRLIFFLDDLNMPEVDDYGTQSGIALVRQQLDCGFWYDRSKLTPLLIQDVQYLACLNPAVGCGEVSERLMGHFSTLAVHPPSDADLYSVFTKVVEAPLVSCFTSAAHARGASNTRSVSFTSAAAKCADRLVAASVALHDRVRSALHPSASKFHYLWSVRDVSSVAQGIMQLTPTVAASPLLTARLWLHETARVYADRLVSDEDRHFFSTMQTEVADRELLASSSSAATTASSASAPATTTKGGGGIIHVDDPTAAAMVNYESLKRDEVFAEPIVFWPYVGSEAAAPAPTSLLADMVGVGAGGEEDNNDDEDDDSHSVAASDVGSEAEVGSRARSSSVAPLEDVLEEEPSGGSLIRSGSSVDIETSILLGDDAPPPPLATHVAGTARSLDDLIQERNYGPVTRLAPIRNVLRAALGLYAQAHSPLRMVLFDAAVLRVCRVLRILGLTGGNAMLVGVGGQGKSSVVRLAAYVAGLSVVRPTTGAGESFSMTDFAEDLKKVIERAGAKGEPVLFLLTEADLVSDTMLVLINDVLAGGAVTSLFTSDERDALLHVVRMEVKAAGIMDTPDRCWEFFKQKLRANLKTVFCLSPVGPSLVQRTRRYPGLLAACSVVWFEPWPREALITVATHYLAGVQMLSADPEGAAAAAALAQQRLDAARREIEEAADQSGNDDGIAESTALATDTDVRAAMLKRATSSRAANISSGTPAAETNAYVVVAEGTLREMLVQFMAFAHASSGEAAASFSEMMWPAYVTPRSFQEFILVFRQLLDSRRASLQRDVKRLERGQQRLAAAASQVSEMREHLATAEADVEANLVQAQMTRDKLGEESSKTDVQAQLALEEEGRCAEISADVAMVEAEAAAELAKAEPAVISAIQALDSLDKASLVELKSFNTPHPHVHLVLKAVMTLLAGVMQGLNVPVPGSARDRVPGAREAALGWKTAKQMMSDVGVFLNELREFKDKIDNFEVPPANFRAVRAYVSSEDFQRDRIEVKSLAAGGICAWVINILRYYDIFCEVEPKRVRLAEAKARLEEAQGDLQTVQSHVADLRNRLVELSSAFAAATEAKNTAMAKAEALQAKLALAKRLMVALAGEGRRWEERAGELRAQEYTLVGDTVLAAAFLVYTGPLTSAFRVKLVRDKWAPFLADLGMPVSTSGADDPIKALYDAATVAEWSDHGLPSGRLSLENGVLLKESKRWPLLVDPQAQGTRFLKAQMAADHLRATDDSTVAGASPTESQRRLKAASRAAELVVLRISTPSEEAVNDGEGTGGGGGGGLLASASSGHRGRRRDEAPWVRSLQHAVTNGGTVLVEQLPDQIPAGLLALVLRETTTSQHGRTQVRVGDKDVDLHPAFRLFLATELSVPAFSPEVQAATTVINFTVTDAILEEQLLAATVQFEEAALESQKAALISAQNRFRIRLHALETELLHLLSAAEGDVLEDERLVRQLEKTKATAEQIALQAEEATVTEERINAARNIFRPVAARGALLFGLLSDLRHVNSLYQFSLRAFMAVFTNTLQAEKDREPVVVSEPTAEEEAKGEAKGEEGAEEEKKGEEAAAEGEEHGEENGQEGPPTLLTSPVVKPPASEVAEHHSKVAAEAELRRKRIKVRQLTHAVTLATHKNVTRGLFEEHKLLFLTALCLRVLLAAKRVSPEMASFLIRGPNVVAAADADGNQSHSNCPFEWISPEHWDAANALSQLTEFTSLSVDMVTAVGRWQDWYLSATPERERLPQDWRLKSTLHQLCIIRALRPDRVPAALTRFIGMDAAHLVPASSSAPTSASAAPSSEQDEADADLPESGLGPDFVSVVPQNLTDVLKEATPSNPVMYFLSPGATPEQQVEELAAKKGIRLWSVSMGQGQCSVAERCLELAQLSGGWVFLQNVHLVPRWLPRLAKLVGEVDARVRQAPAALTPTAPAKPNTASDSPPRPGRAVLRFAGSQASASAAVSATTTTTTTTTTATVATVATDAGHNKKDGKPVEGNLVNPQFVLFLSTEPPPDPRNNFLPVSLLQRSVKVANEPSSDFNTNLRTGLDCFTQADLEGCPSRPSDFRNILFALCFLHATLVGRRKFGCQGWVGNYPFALNDLSIAVNVARNSLESSAALSSVPWKELRYIVGEIIYGGHVSDNWDRRVTATYLEHLMCPALSEEPDFALAPPNETFLFPGVRLPQTGSYESMVEAAKHELPDESPLAYQLHPNAELGILTARTDSLFKQLLALAPDGPRAEGNSEKEEIVWTAVEMLMDQMPEGLSTAGWSDNVTSAYGAVVEQEVVILNQTLQGMLQQLQLLTGVLRGELPSSEPIEALSKALYLGAVPASWAKLSSQPMVAGTELGSWWRTMLKRHAHLTTWLAVPGGDTPPVLWLPGLFCPHAFLAALMQTVVRQRGWELDTVQLHTEITPHQPGEISTAATTGAYVSGLMLEGAHWDDVKGVLRRSRLKELRCVLPVLHLTAMPALEVSRKGKYECPAYLTSRRKTVVFSALLPSSADDKVSTWTLGAVAMLLS